ncbi:cAMP-specific 3',5'-cyclic phosphodiesterase 7B-like, partial [Limulus polyphemus]|uniref:cAMP-specific 3',5'-cyclic phosphodiesterase 7B-like n=1 Tax=Limulus polyphemus TaxID=6850 RepID=A0ABM1TH90_LIMPO
FSDFETQNSRRRLSEEDTSLLEALNASGKERPLAAKPFRTLQRHRVRFPVTKPEIQQVHILDDSYNGFIQYLLSSCWKWNFNAFSLDVATGGRSVSVLLLHLFHHYGFTKKFHLDALKILHCFTLVESGYHRDNPYHNAVHAADVTQALHCFLQEETISKYLDPVEIMACLIAAVCHDLDHPGFTQPFLLATSNHLAVLYKNFSVLETHHWRMAVSCLRESKLLDHLEKDVCVEIERSIQSLILSTDLSLQQDFLLKFKKSMDEISVDLTKKEKRHFVLQVALKCADLCNPCRPWPISKQWSYQVCEELYKQGQFRKCPCSASGVFCLRGNTALGLETQLRG